MTPADPPAPEPLSDEKLDEWRIAVLDRDALFIGPEIVAALLARLDAAESDLAESRRMLAVAVEALEAVVDEIGGCIYDDGPCDPGAESECAHCIARAALARLRPSSPEGER